MEEKRQVVSMPVLSIRKRVLFPGAQLRLAIGKPASTQLIETLLDGGGGEDINDNFIRRRRVYLAIFTAVDDGEKTRSSSSSSVTPSPPPPAVLSGVFSVGCAARVVQITRVRRPQPGGAVYSVLVKGVSRVRIDRAEDLTQRKPFLVANVSIIRAAAAKDLDSVVAMAGALKESARELFELSKLHTGPPQRAGGDGSGNPFTREAVDLINRTSAPSSAEAAILADAIAASIAADVSVLQGILGEVVLERRLKRVLELVQERVKVMTVANSIDKQVEGKLTSKQREFYLRQQLKQIQEELGEGGEAGETDEIDELQAKIEAGGLPADARKAADRELQRLRRMSAAQPEFTVVRNYLEWLADIPWSQQAPEHFDVSAVQAQLDADHYGLDKVKLRITEHVAVRALNAHCDAVASAALKAAPAEAAAGSVGGDEDGDEEEGPSSQQSQPQSEEARQQGRCKDRSPIICLVGPPGVGKTSLGRSIAASLKRPFHRLSLGAVHDEAHIRGHRRTYIGAMPGNIIQALKKVGANNPVILLDEVDKLGRDVRGGDPAAALLEVLDPEQNSTFTDHYINLAFDLSSCFFLATANRTDTIPEPLLDRMELIHIPGYTFQEKGHIASRYLIPKQVEMHGLTPADIAIPPETVHHLATCYTRESGVRNLERELAAVCRHVAVRLATHIADNNDSQNESRRLEPPPPFERVVVTEPMVSAILGPTRFDSETAARIAVPGVSTGLAWTEVGGEILFIECSRMSGKGTLTLTGKLGEVMKESVQIALSWIRSHGADDPATAQVLGLESPLLDFGGGESDLHIHIPAGATPKDGPSAGVALTVALVSLLTGRIVPPTVAMTGEVTLRGLVLPVGGIKEKVLAAHRAGITCVIMPERNRKDLVELPENVRKDLDIVLCATVSEVIRTVFLNSPPEQALAVTATAGGDRDVITVPAAAVDRCGPLLESFL